MSLGAKLWLAFPLGLFWTLFSVTYFIKLCEDSGCFEALTERLQGIVQRSRFWMPLVVFVISAFLSALGIGNIAATALVAPMAMVIAERICLSPFLMTLMIVGGANASVMSPLSAPGLIARRLINAFPAEAYVESGFGVYLFALSFVFIFFVHALGFLSLGGFKWLLSMRFASKHSEIVAPSKRTWKNSEVKALALLGFFCAANLFFGVESFHAFLPELVQKWGKDIGFIATLCVLMAFAMGIGSCKNAFKKLPWKLLALICGLSTFVSLIENEVGFKAVTDLALHAGSAAHLNVVVALSASLLSVFSSSSGVVMPLMLPLVPALVATNLGLGALWLVVIIVISSHLVDCSPFSSLGALSIASVKEGQLQQGKLFRQLFAWGLGMVLVSAALSAGAYHFFSAMF